MMAKLITHSLIAFFTNYSLRKDIFKEEIKTEKGHEKFFFFFSLFLSCLMFKKVKIADFRFSLTTLRIQPNEADPKH